jgi:histidyl-tRNA synthetase
VGAASVAADAEICAMLADVLEAVGIERRDYIIRINNRKVLDGVLEVAGLAGDDKATERGIVLRAIDKLDRLGEAGVRELLGPGRKDESGDITKGAGLSAGQVERVMAFLQAKSAVVYQLDREYWLAEAEEDSHMAISIVRQLDYLNSPSSINPDHPEDANLANIRTIARLGELIRNSKIGTKGIKELFEIYDLLSDLTASSLTLPSSVVWVTTPARYMRPN